ncbi:MAG: type II toxin-antitoxin system RelE/ParE family toxin [Candidatus Scalindua sediminis]|nr:type II toxin-antitoxin system RelE/ParE family toxin [Candidatus Scalindua sediminis]HDY67232.1 type II toxin-antitoxin system RelE/ParE family toxin [Candidatus Scalindua sp.]
MSFELKYHPDVRAVDIPLINSKLRRRIKKAIETRLITAPHQYGEPLRKTLKGYWKLRVGDYRVVFKIVESEVWILGIIHRKDVYKKIKKRV